MAAVAGMAAITGSQRFSCELFTAVKTVLADFDIAAHVPLSALVCL